MYKNNWGYFTVPLTIMAVALVLMAAHSTWQMVSADKNAQQVTNQATDNKARHIAELKAKPHVAAIIGGADDRDFDYYFHEYEVEAAGYTIDEFEKASFPTVTTADSPMKYMVPTLK